MSVPDSFHIQQPLHNLSTWVVLWWEIERCCSRTPKASKGDFKSLITVWWISTERRSSCCATDMQAPHELAVMVVGHITWVITACCHSAAAWRAALFQRANSFPKSLMAYLCRVMRDLQKPCQEVLAAPTPLRASFQEKTSLRGAKPSGASQCCERCSPRGSHNTSFL